MTKMEKRNFGMDPPPPHQKKKKKKKKNNTSKEAYSIIYKMGVKAFTKMPAW